MTARGEIRQKRVEKKGRSVGKKETFEEGETVRLQDMKTKKWSHKGTIEQIRTAGDGRIVSYDIVTEDGVLTSRHRKYIQKVYRTDDIMESQAESTTLSQRERN